MSRLINREEKPLHSIQHTYLTIQTMSGKRLHKKTRTKRERETETETGGEGERGEREREKGNGRRERGREGTESQQRLTTANV